MRGDFAGTVVSGINLTPQCTNKLSYFPSSFFNASIPEELLGLSSTDFL